jgi:hypothetical protein
MQIILTVPKESTWVLIPTVCVKSCNSERKATCLDQIESDKHHCQPCWVQFDELACEWLRFECPKSSIYALVL